jgi:hypothetical protein
MLAPYCQSATFSVYATQCGELVSHGPRRSVLEADPMVRTKRHMLLATLSAGSPYERKRCRGRQFDGNERSSRTRSQWRRPSICARLGVPACAHCAPPSPHLECGPVALKIAFDKKANDAKTGPRATWMQYARALPARVACQSRAARSPGKAPIFDEGCNGRCRSNANQPAPSERRSLLSQSSVRTISPREPLSSPARSRQAGDLVRFVSGPRAAC